MKDICESYSPMGYCCTRVKGHGGKHIANGGGKVFEKWGA